jgi:hypothetical protein
MFSVILHGRNAGHGHNLYKRAAIGRLYTIDKIDRDLERTGQPDCRMTRRF